MACIQSLPDVYSVKRIQTSANMIKKGSASKPQKNYKHKRNVRKSDN